MDKLSSVLPSSPRVKSVDLKNAKPIRPGAPNFFGAPTGSTAGDRMNISEAAKDVAFQETLGAHNPRESSRSKMAEEVTRRFFENRLVEAEPMPVTRGEKQVLELVEEPQPKEGTVKSAKLDLQA